MNTIFKVWDLHPFNGYVSLPAKQGEKWVEKSFKYPEQKEDIKQWIKKNIDLHYNIYWCPTLLIGYRRITSNIPQLYILYADLDESSPYNIPEDLKPSIAWQTSKGRYAAIWILDKPIDSKIGQELNKRLTYYLDADKGGWDLTQVLRIPGLPNYKYNPPSPGKLLWDTDKRYNVNVFKKLPEVVDNVVDSVDIVESNEDINTIIYKHIDKLNPKIIKLLLTPEDEIYLSDRSETLWELECLLVESGLSREEIYTVVKNCSWNKYRGRKDEEKRLKLEIEKAFNNTESLVKPSRRKSITTYSQLMSKKLDEPKWLIKDWWEAGSHGILAGEPKTYKSTVSTEIAVSVASGKPLFGKYEVVKSGAVLIIQEENSEWLMQDRLGKIANSKDLMGEVKVNGNKIQIKSPEDLPIYMANRLGINLTSDEDKEWIVDLIKEIRPVLVIFDPLYLMFGDLDGNSAKELAPVLQWLIELSTDYNTAIMLVHHFNKNGSSSRGGQRMLGSVTFHAWVQSAIYNRVVEGKNSTISVEREFRSFKIPNNIELTFDMGEPGDSYYDVVINENDISIQNVIKTILSTKPQKIRELILQTGMSEKEIKPIINMMVKNGDILYTKEGYKLKGCG